MGLLQVLSRKRFTQKRDRKEYFFSSIESYYTYNTLLKFMKFQFIESQDHNGCQKPGSLTSYFYKVASNSFSAAIRATVISSFRRVTRKHRNLPCLWNIRAWTLSEKNNLLVRTCTRQCHLISNSSFSLRWVFGGDVWFTAIRLGCGMVRSDTNDFI